jgi:hypothetical protein
MAITKISAAMADLDGSVTINESSADADFRVESDGNSKAISILGDKYGLGVGRDPESAYNGYTSIELGQQATLIANDAGDDLGLKVNTYLDSGGNWKRKETGVAAAFDMDGDQIKFFTAASGSADANITFAQKLRIDSDGIKFGTDTAAANALDDYEEGTWSVDLIGCDDNLSSPTGHYTKIGRLVYFYWYSGAVTISNQSGVAFIDGLPFTTRSNNGQAYSTFQYLHGDAVDGNSTGGYVEHAANKMRFIDAGTTDSASYVNGARYIMVSGIYEVA